MAYKVGFGRNADRTIEWLFFNDPGYVWWMLDYDADKGLSGLARVDFFCKECHHDGSSSVLMTPAF